MKLRRRKESTGVQNSQDWSTGPFARLSPCLLAPLTRLLAPPNSHCLSALLRSLICSLANFAHSLACGTVNDQMTILCVVFFSVFDHSELVEKEKRN